MRFQCPHGCNVSYSRERDLIRRHVSIVHGINRIPSPIKPLNDGGSPQRRVSKKALSIPRVSEHSTTLNELIETDQKPSRKSTEAQSLQISAISDSPSPRTDQWHLTPSPYMEIIRPIQLSASWETVKELKASLEAAYVKLDLVEFELRMAKSQLEMEKAARNLMESQVNVERANTMHTFELLRRTRASSN